MTERNEYLTELPPSFADEMAPNYLGSPTVVLGILEEFVTEIYGWVAKRSSGEMSAEEMTELAFARSRKFSAIFSGENPDYAGIVGWNTRSGGGLGAYLKADLGHYWQSNRESFGDDPYRACYGWLLWATVDAMKIEDEDLTAMKMGDRLQSAVRLLTGSTRRA
jgi:hypothetical protein